MSELAQIAELINANPDRQDQLAMEQSYRERMSRSVFDENGYLLTKSASTMFTSIRTTLSESGLLGVFADDREDERNHNVRELMTQMQASGEIYIGQGEQFDTAVARVQANIKRNILRKNAKVVDSQPLASLEVFDQILLKPETKQTNYFPRTRTALALAAATLAVAVIACSCEADGDKNQQQRRTEPTDEPTTLFIPSIEEVQDIYIDSYPPIANPEVEMVAEEPPVIPAEEDDTQIIQVNEEEVDTQQDIEFQQSLTEFVDVNPDNNRTLEVEIDFGHRMALTIDPDFFGANSLVQAIFAFNKLTASEKLLYLQTFGNFDGTNFVDANDWQVEPEFVDTDDLQLSLHSLKYDPNIYAQLRGMGRGTIHDFYDGESTIYLPVDLTGTIDEGSGIDYANYSIRIAPDYFETNMTLQEMLNAVADLPFSQIMELLVDSNGNPLPEHANGSGSEADAERLSNQISNYSMPSIVATNPEAFFILTEEDSDKRGVLRNQFTGDALTYHGASWDPEILAEITDQEVPASAGATLLMAAQMDEEETRLYAYNSGQSVSTVSVDLPESYREVYAEAEEIVNANPESFGIYDATTTETAVTETGLTTTIEATRDANGNYWLPGVDGGSVALSDVVRYWDRTQIVTGELIEFTYEGDAYALEFRNTTLAQLLVEAEAPNTDAVWLAVYEQNRSLFLNDEMVDWQTNTTSLP